LSLYFLHFSDLPTFVCSSLRPSYILLLIPPYLTEFCLSFFVTYYLSFLLCLLASVLLYVFLSFCLPSSLVNSINTQRCVRQSPRGNCEILISLAQFGTYNYLILMLITDKPRPQDVTVMITVLVYT